MNKLRKCFICKKKMYVDELWDKLPESEIKHYACEFGYANEIK